MLVSHRIAICLAGSLLVPAELWAQDRDSKSAITVTAPRQGPRSPSGDLTETVSHSIRVNVSDLDLATPAGLSAAETRFRAAAKKSCTWLDEHYPVVDSETGCEKDAVASAMARARALGQ